MTNPIPTHDANVALTKLINLLGPPPLLRNESFEDFKEVFAGLFAALGPEDFLMEVQVYHLAIETRLIFRLTRYEAAQLNQLEKDQRQTSALMVNNQTLASGTKVLREKYPHLGDSDPEYLIAYAKLKEEAAADYQGVLNGAPTDGNYVWVSAECSAFVEKIELRINRALKRRDDILRQIAWWRLGLSKKLRKVSDAIIVGTDTPLGATSDVVGLIAPGDHDGRAS